MTSIKISIPAPHILSGNLHALNEDGVEQKDIKSRIGTAYRDQYKDAYRKRDTRKMIEIESKLILSGFDFDIHGKTGWESQVDNESSK